MSSLLQSAIGSQGQGGQAVSMDGGLHLKSLDNPHQDTLDCLLLCSFPSPVDLQYRAASGILALPLPSVSSLVSAKGLCWSPGMPMRRAIHGPQEGAAVVCTPWPSADCGMVIKGLALLSAGACRSSCLAESPGQERDLQLRDAVVSFISRVAFGLLTILGNCRSFLLPAFPLLPPPSEKSSEGRGQLPGKVIRIPLG
ncbi:nucleoplasmin-3 isoform X1 [Apteryx rowi]|uniref:nucleoplasmin-3 isoform X1 n=1 Tax=Apteryx rowi TaxID=308060 RepID=UPI000E1D9263|nr:nucleoplasmin-3 isoform X1 [Apteryx rowi]XP_025925337.1 nucleoplasmin-3 isoform X1 [Apteryx rowi]